MLEQILLAQFTGILLLLATPLALRRGLPSTGAVTRAFSSLLRSLRWERPPRRVRRTAMRGARPWWE